MLGIGLAVAGGILLSFADAGKKVLARSLSPELIILLISSFGIVVTIVFLSIMGFPDIEWASVWLPMLVCAAFSAEESVHKELPGGLN